MPPVPSKRYDLFIQYFEKRVSEAQKKIEELRKFEPLYNVTREILEKHNLKNDIKINQIDWYLMINITAMDDDHYKDFIPLVSDICKELIRLKLRSGEISYNVSKASVWSWCWQLSTSLGLIIYINLIMPHEGNKYLKIVCKEVMEKGYRWESEWMEK